MYIVKNLLVSFFCVIIPAFSQVSFGKPVKINEEWQFYLPQGLFIEASAIDWDIMDKTMDAWNRDGGSELNKAWSLSKTYLKATQETGYVNL